MKLNEVKYYTPDWEPSRIKRLVKRLSKGEFVRKNSGPNTFYYQIPDFKYAYDNLMEQFGKPYADGYLQRREGPLPYYIWVISGWKVKLSAEDMKVEVWRA